MHYDVAFSLPLEDVVAYGIIFSEFEGRRFNWNTMTYERQE